MDYLDHAFITQLCRTGETTRALVRNKRLAFTTSFIIGGLVTAAIGGASWLAFFNNKGTTDTSQIVADIKHQDQVDSATINQLSLLTQATNEAHFLAKLDSWEINLEVFSMAIHHAVDAYGAYVDRLEQAVQAIAMGHFPVQHFTSRSVTQAFKSLTQDANTLGYAPAYSHVFDAAGSHDVPG